MAVRLLRKHMYFQIFRISLFNKYEFIYGMTYEYIHKYIHTYIHTDTTCIQHVNVGLAQVHTNRDIGMVHLWLKLVGHLWF